MFNDGTPFNAAGGRDVAAAQHDAAHARLRASDYSPVDSVTASGPYTVVFHLSKPDFAAAPRTRRPCA